MQFACGHCIQNENNPMEFTNHKQWAKCIQLILDAAPKAVLEKTSEEDGEMSYFHLILQQKPLLDLVEYMEWVWAKQKGVDMSVAWKEILKECDVSRKGKCYGMLPIHYSIRNMHHQMLF